MTVAGPERSVVDLLMIESVLGLLEAVQAAGAGLVVVRGSTAVLAHSPVWARVPVDLDVFWLGAAQMVPDLIKRTVSETPYAVQRVRRLRPPDPRLRALHRVDLLCRWDATGAPTHRFWLDIGTSRHAVARRRIGCCAGTGRQREIVTVTIEDLLAEKLWVYLESAQFGREDLRWTDLFDMLALIGGSPGIERISPQRLRSSAAAYFARRGAHLPAALPAPPSAWLSVWYRLCGPVADRAPSLEEAGRAAAAFWRPVLRAPAPSRLRWLRSGWRWGPIDDRPSLLVQGVHGR